MTEHESRLTACNRKLVRELNASRERLAIAQRGIDLLRKAACGDWQEAYDVVSAWDDLAAKPTPTPTE